MVKKILILSLLASAPAWAQTSTMPMLLTSGAGIIYTQPALVHQTSVGGCVWSSGLTITCTITAPSTSNVLVVLCGSGTNTTLVCSHGSATAPIVPTYTGATWTEFAESDTARPVAGWCATLTGSPGTSLVMNLANAPAVNAWVGAYEISGTNGCQFDGAAVNNTNAGSTTPTSGSITPTYLGYDLALFADSNSNSAFSSGPTNSFTAFNIPQASRGNTAYFLNTLGGTTALSTGVTLAGSVAWDAIIALIEGSASTYSSAPTLTQHTAWIASSNSSVVSTVNASLLAITVQSRHGHTCLPADSMSNTWTAGTTYTDSTNIDETTYYTLSPATSVLHTFNVTGSGCNTTQNMLAFHRQTAFTLDGTNGTSAATTNTISTGTVTPSVANGVCVSALAQGGATISALTVPSGFTAPDAAATYNSGTGQPGSQAAYVLSPTSGVGINATWSWTTNDTWIAANLLCFK